MTSDSDAASAAAEQVASVLEAAERAAAQMRLEAEERLRSRIAEGDRAAELRVGAAEEEAAEILAAAAQEVKSIRDEAENEAKRIVSEASSKGLEVIGKAQAEADRLRAEGTKSHDEAASRAQDLMRAAEQTAAEIDIEGMQIVRDLRELGDSLRANAERLLRDVQKIHSRMIGQIERIESAALQAPGGDPAAEASEGPDSAGADEPTR